MKKPHIAIIDEELPFPLTSGKRIRTFNLVTRLTNTNRITFISHRNPDPAEEAQARQAFAWREIELMFPDYTVPPKSGFSFYKRLLKNCLFSRLPYSVQSHHSEAMNRAITALIKTNPPDLWHCEWSPYAEFMRNRDVPWVVMAHNVESLIWKRMAQTETNLFKKLLIRDQYRKFRNFECWAYSQATRAIAVSDEDANLIRLEFADRDVDVVENGVDPTYFGRASFDDCDPNQFLFLGSLDWRPNQDGVKLLCEEIFPKVVAVFPEAQLNVVGRKPPQWMAELIANTPNVQLYSDVPDVRPYLHKANALLVPLRIGGGSRLKILEALSSAVPVITTSIGVEGLRLNDRDHVTIADQPTTFANYIEAAIRDPQSFRIKAHRGREVVLEEYTWNRLAEKLDAMWADAITSSKTRKSK